MYKLYRDTGDLSDPYIIIYKKQAIIPKNKCVGWFSSLLHIPTELKDISAPYVTLENLEENAHGQLILLYESERQPTTEYLRKTHPELFI